MASSMTAETFLGGAPYILEPFFQPRMRNRQRRGFVGEGLLSKHRTALPERQGIAKRVQQPRSLPELP
jgi:hypothetical protein